MKKIYLDAYLYIYYFEAHPQFGRKVTQLFEDAERGSHLIVASPLVLHEIMSGIYDNPKLESEELYSLIVTHPGVSWVDYSIEIADLSAHLRAKAKLRTPDAIHLATAIHSECQNFVTNDKKLEKLELESRLQILAI